MNALTWVATAVVALAIVAVVAAAVLAVLDDRKVRRTDEFVEQFRRGQDADDLGDDVVAYLKAWRRTP